MIEVPGKVMYAIHGHSCALNFSNGLLLTFQCGICISVSVGFPLLLGFSPPEPQKATLPMKQARSSRELIAPRNSPLIYELVYEFPSSLASCCVPEGRMGEKGE